MAKRGFKEAIANFDTALELRPDYVEALNNKGNAWMGMGRNDEAIDCFNQVLEFAPDYFSAHYGLAFARTATPQNQNILGLEKLVESSGLKPNERSQLNFALGKTYGDLDKCDQAFNHFQQGNQLDHRSPKFDADAHEAYVERIIENFNEELFSKRNLLGNPSNQPIFIAGMQRSGRALSEQVLASHTNIHAGGDLGLIEKIVDSMPDYIRGIENFPEGAASMSIDAVAAMAKTYLDGVALKHGRPRRITDTSPGNLFHLGLISIMFPNAKFIHCRRQPLDLALSCFSQYFPASLPYSNDLASFGRYYAAYDKLMAHWHKMMPGRILDVQYEGITKSLKSSAQAIFEFCGLEWEDSCLEFDKATPLPIYLTSVGRWRDFDKHLAGLKGDLRDAFYEIS